MRPWSARLADGGGSTSSDTVTIVAPEAVRTARSAGLCCPAPRQRQSRTRQDRQPVRPPRRSPRARERRPREAVGYGDDEDDELWVFYDGDDPPDRASVPSRTTTTHDPLAPRWLPAPRATISDRSAGPRPRRRGPRAAPERPGAARGRFSCLRRGSPAPRALRLRTFVGPTDDFRRKPYRRWLAGFRRTSLTCGERTDPRRPSRWSRKRFPRFCDQAGWRSGALR